MTECLNTFIALTVLKDTQIYNDYVYFYFQREDMMIIMKLALQVATVTAGCRRLRVTSSSLPKKHPRVLASSCRMRERQPGLVGGGGGGHGSDGLWAR